MTNNNQETQNFVDFMLKSATDTQIQDTLGCGTTAELQQLFTAHGVSETDGMMLVNAVRDSESSADFSQTLLGILKRMGDFLWELFHFTVFTTTCYQPEVDDDDAVNDNDDNDDNDSDDNDSDDDDSDDDDSGDDN